jgi:hypothetical protein
MQFPMIYADDAGETHFGLTDLPERDVALGPPPTPQGR